MAFIDGLLDAILAIGFLIWIVFAKAWFIIIPLAIVYLYIWRKGVKCPKCASLFTSHHSPFMKDGGYQADWFPVRDRETGDWYAVRYNRVCNDCNHKWTSWLHTDPDDPRPARKKIYDKKSWKAFEEHIKNGGKILD